MSGDTSNIEVEDLSKITVEDFKKKQFSSEQEAYSFYLEYSKCVGFGVRRDDAGRDKNKRYITQRYVCICEGKPRKKPTGCAKSTRKPRGNKRIGCLAHLKVKLNDETSKWGVYSFEPDHNHAMVLPCYSHLIPSHRQMTEADQALVNSMMEYGVKASVTMDFMTGLAGGPEKVGFTRKDMYNYNEKQRKMKISDGDANSALNYLQGKADSDPKFFVSYSVDGEDCLENLFWCDGHSQFDYECFGDVIAFDTTYKVNKYSKPFVMFTGVNHHGNNIIFACALLVDESEETYIWVLEKLMEVMQNKKPYAVVTDGDKAMRKAIKAIFPNVCHRLCAWHLSKNATSNIHSDKFSQELSKCMYGNMNIDSFEIEWKSLIERFSLSNNKWVEKMYKKRHMWATAYLREKFFAGIRTTSRCESTNSFFKKYLKSHYNLLEFVQHFERGMKHNRHRDVEANYHTLYGRDPYMTTSNHALEQHASKIYTCYALELFRKQLKISEDCMVVGVEKLNSDCSTYKVEKYLSPGVIFYVTTENETKMIKCCCYTYESTGIPCGHVIAVLKFNHIRELPACILLKRWTKEAKDIVPHPDDAEFSAEKIADLRLGSLSIRCQYMSFLASKNVQDYNDTRQEVEKIISRLEMAQINSENSQNNDNHGKVNDPKVSKTKGCPKKKNITQRRSVHCGNCKEIGHTRRSCPHPIVGDLSMKENESSSSSDGVGDSTTLVCNATGFPPTCGDVKLPQIVTPITQNFATHGSLPVYHGFSQSASSLLGLMDNNVFPQVPPTTLNFTGQSLPSFTPFIPFGSNVKMESLKDNSNGNGFGDTLGSSSYNPHAFFNGATQNMNNPSNGN